MLAFENFSSLPAVAAYDIYTLVFGLLALALALFIWQGRKIGWVGTVLVSLFVIVIDALTLLDLPSIPGVPKLPAFAEITYSLLIIIYLIQSQISKKFLH